MLSAYAQLLAAGHDDPYPGGGREQPGEQRRRLHDVFEVVAHQQHLPIPQAVLQGGRGAVLADPQAQRGADRRRDIGGGLGVGQRGERDAVAEHAGQPVAQLGDQPGLADTARPENADQPRRARRDQPLQRGQILLPADGLVQQRRGRRQPLRGGDRLRVASARRAVSATASPIGG